MRVAEVSIPGKTFLIGEYLALQGGPSVLAGTGPRFRLRVQLDGRGAASGIHPQSPAGHWIRENAHVFSRWDVEFIDPHQGRGGAGASTAQFLAVYVLQRWSQGLWSEPEEGSFLDQLWQDYRNSAWSGEGLPPSGADLIAQWLGSLTEVRTGPVAAETLEWTFHGKEFAIVRTGFKVPTHEHLRLLDLGALENLSALAEGAVSALRSGNWMSFGTCINTYYQELLARGWVAEATQKLVETVADWPETEAVKGCGAMGADTLAIFYDLRDRESLMARLREAGLELMAQRSDLSPGVHLSFQAGVFGWEPRGEAHA